jgi:hypothetical protein
MEGAMIHRETARDRIVRLRRAVLNGALLLSSLPAAVVAEPSPNPAETREVEMMHARGEFDVRVQPLALDGPVADASFGRYALIKELRGDFTGKGEGQMLSAGGAVESSGAYVAIERLSGTLAGREGSFALFHRGVMQNGEQELLVTVVPDSGTGALVGIRGRFQIHIDGKRHDYEFEYELPATQ